MTVRISKIIIVFSLTLFVSLVAFGNLTDYSTNFQFVRHVLLMDSISNESILYRSVVSPIWHSLAYYFIILLELLSAIFLWISFFKMSFFLNYSDKFKSAKNIGITGLLIGFVLWFTGFFAIGSEWFGMWQTKYWNGQEAAFRIVVIFLISMLYLSMDNE